MTEKTNRREFVQVAGLAAFGTDGGCRSLPLRKRARPAARTMGARFRIDEWTGAVW